jgi:uncharacterized protein (TIRG00374 family)
MLINVNNFSWRDVLGFGLSVGLFWLTWQQSGIAEKGLVFSSKDGWWLVCAIVAFLISLGVHVMRAHLLWRGRVDVTHKAIAKSLFIGNFFNVVLPGNLGEGVRAWHFHRTAQVGFWKSVASIITEKFVDAQLYALALILLFGMWYVAWSEPVFWVLVIVWCGILGVNIVLLLLQVKPRWEKKLWSFVPGKKVRNSLFKTYRHLFFHLRHLNDGNRLWLFAVLGYVLLSLSVVQYYFVLQAAGLGSAMNNFSVCFLIAMVMVVINVTPSAPGSAGVVHYGIFATLTIAAKLLVLPQQSASFAMAGVYLHFSYFIPETIIGAWLVWRERSVLRH